MIALSGVYDARFFVGDFGGDEAIYQNSPSDYIWHQNDGWFIDRYRQAEIRYLYWFRAWEQDGLPSLYKLKEAFDHKNIPAWFADGAMTSPTIGTGGASNALFQARCIYKLKRRRPL